MDWERQYFEDFEEKDDSQTELSSFISLKLSEDPVVREAVACQMERRGHG